MWPDGGRCSTCCSEQGVNIRMRIFNKVFTMQGFGDRITNISRKYQFIRGLSGVQELIDGDESI